MAENSSARVHSMAPALLPPCRSRFLAKTEITVQKENFCGDVSENVDNYASGDILKNEDSYGDMHPLEEIPFIDSSKYEDLCGDMPPLEDIPNIYVEIPEFDL